jgi:FMN-dependent NADH-azoreductase
MAKVLYITANPKPVSQSFGLQVGEAFLQAYKEKNPHDEIVPIDLYQTDIPYIDIDVMSGWGKLAGGETLSGAEKRKVERLGELADQFVGADKYVIVTPLWNFSVPPLMKAYIDSICVAGKTFKYTENGSVGLLGDKKAVHIQASGGVYSEGPGAAVEHGTNFIRDVLGFLGITNLTTILVEGMAAQPQNAEQIKNAGIDRAKQVAAEF